MPGEESRDDGKGPGAKKLYIRPRGRSGKVPVFRDVAGGAGRSASGSPSRTQVAETPPGSETSSLSTVSEFSSDRVGERVIGSRGRSRDIGRYEGLRIEVSRSPLGRLRSHGVSPGVTPGRFGSARSRRGVFTSGRLGPVPRTRRSPTPSPPRARRRRPVIQGGSSGVAVSKSEVMAGLPSGVVVYPSHNILETRRNRSAAGAPGEFMPVAQRVGFATGSSYVGHYHGLPATPPVEARVSISVSRAAELRAEFEVLRMVFPVRYVVILS